MLDTGHNTKIHSFDQISLSLLLAESNKLEAKESHDLLLKSLNRVAFELLWRRHNGDATHTRVFSSIGQIGEYAIGDKYESKYTFRMTLKRISHNAPIGKIRSKVSYCDDIRFVVYSNGAQAFLFLDNEATNVRLPQAYIFDTEAGSFIPCEKMSLIDSFISYKIPV